VPLHILVSKRVRYMSPKSHTHKRCGKLRKKSFSARGYAEIHIQRPFFDNKNSIWKFLGLKIQTKETCSSTPSTHRNIFFWKILNYQFLAEFQSFIFGQILANFGNFGQFWADFAALTVANSMPQHGLKSLKPHNVWTISPNDTCSISLESYNPYLQPQKVSKNQKNYCIYISLPRITKSHIWESQAFRG
jgi:hypothetical protein